MPSNSQRLKRLRNGIIWEKKDSLENFVLEVYKKIKNWRGNPPSLEFFWFKDIDQLLLTCVEQGDAEETAAAREFILLVAATGYRHVLEPEDDGSPRGPYTTAIHRAARLIGTRRYSTETIQALFRIYGNFDYIYEDESGLDHFHAACILGCDFAVTEYLRLGRDPDFLCQEEAKAPIHLAAQYNQVLVLESLLYYGADPNTRTSDKNETPLHLICKLSGDRMKLAEKFFEICHIRRQYVDMNVRDQRGNTPLIWALIRESWPTVELLLREGADPNAIGQDEWTPLRVLCDSWKPNKLLVPFIELNKELGNRLLMDAKDNIGSAPLHLALSRCNRHAIQVLIENGADPNLPNSFNRTPLHIIAMKRKDDDFLDFFLSLCKGKRVEVNTIESKCGKSPLHFAVQDGLREVAVKLLRLGADPNMPNAYGATALHYICNSRQQERDVVEFLEIFFRVCDEMGHELLIDAETDKQESPLHFAVAYLLLEPIDLLLERGADASKLVFPKSLLSREDIDFDRKSHLTEPLRKASLVLTILERLQERGYEQTVECAQTIAAFFEQNSLFDDDNKPKVESLRGEEMNCNESTCDEQRNISGDSIDDEEDDCNHDQREYYEKKDIYEEVDIDELIKNKSFIDETQQIKFASSKPLDDYYKRVEIMMQDIIEEEEPKKDWSLYDVLSMPAGKAERLFTYQDYLEFARSDKLFFMDEQQTKACIKRLTEKMARGYFKYLALYALIQMNPLKQLDFYELISEIQLNNRQLSFIYLAYARSTKPNLPEPEQTPEQQSI
ncbi:hypothetical protein TKK_0004003 [Trichogramma kaykai]|uniref:Uncharacterized protein n=1 Tax=Trichogramma kaykai TaxID=54128 RepID=A0ABD2XNJ1_9HYME